MIKILVESDHKPFKTIFKKPIYDCPARLQSIRLKLQKYDLTVKYKPRKELLIADALSQSFLKDEKLELDKEINVQVCLIQETLPISLEKKRCLLKKPKY